LFDELAAAKSLPNDGEKESDFGEVPGRKRAFFVLRRVPDPNNSHRNVTNSWFFVDKAGRLTLPMLEAFAKNPVLADTQAEFVGRLQTTDFTPNVISPDPKDPSLVCDPESPASKTSQLRLKLQSISVPTIILLATAIILAVLTRQNSGNSEPEPIPPIGEPQTIDSRWASETLKWQLREAIGPGKAIDLEDDQLLQEFVKLFSFDPKSLNLSHSQYVDMQCQSKSDKPNPFAKFLLELPTPREVSDVDFKGTPAQQFRHRISQLASEVNVRTVQNGDMVDLTSLNPEEIVSALRNRLNYRSYYENWHHQFQPNQKQDPWLDQWEVDGDKAWIPEVRKFIKDNY